MNCKVYDECRMTGDPILLDEKSRVRSACTAPKPSRLGELPRDDGFLQASETALQEEQDLQGLKPATNKRTFAPRLPTGEVQRTESRPLKAQLDFRG